MANQEQAQQKQSPPRTFLSSDTITKASALLLSTIDVSWSIIKNYGFKNAYLGDSRKVEVYPNRCLYLLFEYSKDTDIELISNILRANNGYLDEYDPKDGQVVFVIKVPERWHRVYDLFIQGKYGEFDKEYISKYFPQFVFNGLDAYGNARRKESHNFKVLTRAESLRKEIEESLGVQLKPDAELLSKPNSRE